MDILWFILTIIYEIQQVLFEFNSDYKRLPFIHENKYKTGGLKTLIFFGIYQNFSLNKIEIFELHENTEIGMAQWQCLLEAIITMNSHEVVNSVSRVYNKEYFDIGKWMQMG